MFANIKISYILLFKFEIGTEKHIVLEFGVGIFF